jgi:head-tail adaptor
MRARKRDKSISIERLVENLDELGVPREARAPIRTAKAAIIQASAEAFFGSGGIAAESIVVVRIRSIEGVMPAERIVSSDRVFDVKEIKAIGRRRGHELRAVAR